MRRAGAELVARRVDLAVDPRCAHRSVSFRLSNNPAR
jgi:hypothetical protein